MAYSSNKPSASDAKKMHDSEFTKQDIKKGFSVSLMYGETGEPSNAITVWRRNWRKESEDTSR